MRFVCDLLFVGMRNAIDQLIHSFKHMRHAREDEELVQQSHYL